MSQHLIEKTEENHEKRQNSRTESIREPTKHETEEDECLQGCSLTETLPTLRRRLLPQGDDRGSKPGCENLKSDNNATTTGLASRRGNEK